MTGSDSGCRDPFARRDFIVHICTRNLDLDVVCSVSYNATTDRKIFRTDT